MTSELEKLILKGKAESKVLSCFGAQFYSLLVPTGQTLVVTQIDWTPFINFPFFEDRFPGLNELQMWCQYQLKISDDKNSHYFHFDNNINFNVAGNPSGYNASDSINRWGQTGAIFQPGAMVVIPCYFPIQQELRMAITRGNLFNMTTQSGNLNTISKEPFSPNGVKNINQVNYITNPGPSINTNYLPGTELNSSVPRTSVGNNSDGYYFGTDPFSGYDSLIPIDQYPYYLRAFTQPQFVIHYTIIKENLTGLID